MNTWIFSFIVVMNLIAAKVILFNEEFLVFLAFSTFIYITWEKLKTDAKNYFEKKRFNKQQIFVALLNSSCKQTEAQLKFNRKMNQLNITFFNLKNHYLNLNNDFFFKSMERHKTTNNINIRNKIKFFIKLEKGNGRMIFPILVKKSNKITHTNLFFKKKTSIIQFQTLNRVSLHECIKAV
uniref:ATP synthase F0 subunit b n=1 Tax=Bostrychia tenuissima TaxID=196631 RepID=UPI002E7A9488|nr:ATP synthase F0 subunit b [Bostrychia tenuissima]WQF69435.1 ATP synthase F0 subunit b [Bostrychia tenuissima]